MLKFFCNQNCLIPEVVNFKLGRSTSHVRIRPSSTSFHNALSHASFTLSRLYLQKHCFEDTQEIIFTPQIRKIHNFRHSVYDYQISCGQFRRFQNGDKRNYQIYLLRVGSFSSAEQFAIKSDLYQRRNFGMSKFARAGSFRILESQCGDSGGCGQVSKKFTDKRLPTNFMDNILLYSILLQANAFFSLF